ncbi:Fic family protein [Prolixibacter bellariivorans]|uniref:Fic family protein n=1 Tax=Prolixibacter bellariivorans TaxID=314319 RepID=UPI000A510C00|nr:Fic family protein [Prolixibacter bellariivorans]
MIERPPKIDKKHFSKALIILKDKNSLDVIRRSNNKYLYWDKVKYQTTSDDFSPIDLWAAIKLTRNLDYKYLQFGKYKFAFSQTDYIQEILHKFDLNVGGNLGAQKLIPEQEKDKYLISSIMEEAIASSQIEGAVTTRKKAKEMLRKNDKPRSKSEQMILNNYRTIQTIVNLKKEPLTINLLLEIHKQISYNTLADKSDEGKFRDSNDIYVVNHIESEIVHTPPDFKEIPELMEQICLFFNNDKHDYFIHPVIKGIILHFMIGYVHPFVDGNGRTARALFYWYLLSKGYWLTEYLSISRLIIKSKNQYESAYLYTENDENDLTYFINYNLKTMDLAYDALRVYIQRKIDEKKYITNFQRIQNINDRQAEIIKWFYDEPNLLITVKEVENRLHCFKPNFKDRFTTVS